jgi:uncharacterized protein Yka (UPF0111/DUF47 family)
MSCNDEQIISELKEIWEYTNWLKNMFVNIKKYEEFADKINEKISKMLYELTGDKFYIEHSATAKGDMLNENH